MTEIYVKTQDFVDMLTALLPFTRAAKTDEKEAGRAVPCETIDIQTGTNGKLILTATSFPGIWAIGEIPLADYSGELTDFALHRDDAALITKQFKPQPESMETLQLKIEHTESTRREKKQTGEYLEHLRSTLITIDEETKLVGGRSSRFPGLDARHFFIADNWRHLATEKLPEDSRPTAVPLDPSSIKRLTAAARVLGQPIVTPLADRLIIRIGNTFLAYLANPTQAGAVPSRSLEAWASELFEEAERLPEHQIFEQLTSFEEVPVGPDNIHYL